MLWKLIIPAIDAGYDDLADILAVVSLVLNIANAIIEESYSQGLRDAALLYGTSVAEYLADLSE